MRGRSTWWRRFTLILHVYSWKYNDIIQAYYSPLGLVRYFSSIFANVWYAYLHTSWKMYYDRPGIALNIADEQRIISWNKKCSHKIYCLSIICMILRKIHLLSGKLIMSNPQVRISWNKRSSLNIRSLLISYYKRTNLHRPSMALKK